MFKPLFLTTILLLGLSTFAQQDVTIAGKTYSSADTLPTDDTIRIGQLDNGLRYYLRHNEEPVNRAELALAIRVGSLMEDDDQQGIAHFLEHMLFNGTESFESTALVDYLESTGMVFGPDVNAYTSPEETVYTIRIPLDDDVMIDNAFTILAEWANKATLDPEEIDKERGIIKEEERIRLQNVNGRISDALLPVLYGENSRYVQRLVIGDIDIIQNAPAETFARFYRDWYRPDLMAVVVVGDFDVDAFEKRIQDGFAGLESPQNAPELQSFPIAEHDEGRYFVYRDPEFPYTISQIIYKIPAASSQTLADFTHRLERQAFSFMFNERLAAIINSADAPFLDASISIRHDLSNIDLIEFTSVTEADKSALGLQRLLSEMERVRRFGFTESELERARISLLSSVEESYSKRDDIDSAAWRDYILTNFLNGDILTSSETDLALAQQLVPTLDITAINHLAATLNQEANRVTLLIAPDNDALALPSEADLAAFFVQAQEEEIVAYQEEDSADELLSEIPDAVDIISEEYVTSLDVHVLELANGITIVFKATDFVAEEVLLSATSFGGNSRVSDEDFFGASIIPNIIASSGIADFEETELRRLLTGKQVFVAPYISETQEGFTGKSTTQDIETLFQLVYLYATQPRYDVTAFERFRTQITTFLENRDNLPNQVLNDAVIKALYGDDIRKNVPDIADIEAIDYDRAFAVYQERFADMDDFVFTIVGDISLDELKPLVQRYLGNLPQRAGEETWRDVVPALPLGITETNVYKGLEEQSVLNLRFIGEALDLSFAEKRRMNIFNNVLDILLRKKIREDLGASYSVNAVTRLESIPDATYSASVNITTNPDDVDSVTNAIFDIASQLQNSLIDESLLDTAKEQYLRSREESLEDNGFWLSTLDYYYAIEPDADIQQILDYVPVIDAISTQDIQDLAQRYLDEERYISVVLYPEALAPSNAE